MSERIKFYIQKPNLEGEPVNPIVSLEDDYDGLFVSSVKGLEDRGKPKNIYTESYAESDELRVYLPEKICREATDITLKLVFLGKDRRRTFDDFYNFVKQGKFYYWDNVRNKKALLFLASAVKPSDDIVRGSNQYIIAEFKFKNLYGECKMPCEMI